MDIMKRPRSLKTLCAVFFLLPVFLAAQTVVTIPVYPTDIDSCTVIFDATQGNAGLKDVPPPIYAHTGVLTNLSTSSSDWKYVIADWNQNTPKALMTPLGNNLYQLKLTPSIRDFYGVPAGETIQKLAFVFRNSDGSKAGREANGGDIFADVYPASLSVNITLPTESELILQQGDTIPVTATSPLADSLFLFLNNVLQKKTGGTTITDTLIAENFGSNFSPVWISIRAKNDTAAAADSLSYMVVPQPLTAALPAGMTDGINYPDETTVVLSLYAPEKAFAFVIGDFNGWEPDSLYYMHRDTTGDRYWIQVNGLTPGQEYLFQYLVDGTIRIADPYTDKVCDPNDQYISPTTYPGLIPYPTGSTTGITAVLQTAQTPYPWSTAAFTPAGSTDLVIYELLLRDFLEAHDFSALEDTLDYLARLGVNAIELMPVSEFEGNSSWGYNPDFLFAADKYYGPKNTLKHLVETAHSKGMAVIMDLVLNHQFGSSPLVRLYWDEANNRPAGNSPWFNPIPKHPYNVGYDFNHDSPDTRAYCDKVLRYWIEEYHIDGYRFDLSKGLTQVNSYPNDVGLWGQYDPNRISILNHYYDVVRAADTNGILILEHFADNGEEKQLSSDGMLLWGNMNSKYIMAAQGFTSGGLSDLSWISYKQRGWTDPHVVGYMESHDEERVMYKCISGGNSSGSYTTRDTLTALKRMELAAAFFYTIPGPKMLWEFGELGYDYSITYGGDRLAPKPPRWDYQNEWCRRYLFNICASLIELKKNREVFKTDDYAISLSGALKRINLNSAPMKVTVIGNFDVKAGTIDPEFQQTGTWYDYFSGDSLVVTDVNESLPLDPGEYHLYTSVKLPKPMFTGVEEREIPTAGSHSAILCPNPTRGTIRIIAQASIEKTELYSISGSLLQTAIHSNEMDLSPLPRGIYYLRISYSSESQEILKVVKQ